MEYWQKYHNAWGLGDIKYEVGDIITRHGGDEQKILAINYDYETLVVECIKEPEEKWIELGERESNLIRRYLLVRKGDFDMRNQKPAKPWRNKKYREFVADNPCLYCRIDGRSVPHHCRDLVESGWGTKPGDQWCIPVCDKCHKALHDYPDYISKQTKLNFIADSLNRWMK